MTKEQFNKEMDELLERDPFQAFTVFLKDGRRIEINDPWKVLYRREGMAIWVDKDILGEEFDQDTVSRFGISTQSSSFTPV